ncbi:hypothetical protein ABIF70_005117 [Bradyrhizobium japonicum]
MSLMPEQSGPKIVLLEAAGSEGKSTAVLHTAATLLEDERQLWTCLYREVSAAPVPEEDLEFLYAALAQGAAKHFRNHTSNHRDRTLWTRQFANGFVERGERWWPAARSVAKALYHNDLANAAALITYSSVHRRSGRVDDAMNVLKAYYLTIVATSSVSGAMSPLRLLILV